MVRAMEAASVMRGSTLTRRPLAVSWLSQRTRSRRRFVAGAWCPGGCSGDSPVDLEQRASAPRARPSVSHRRTRAARGCRRRRGCAGSTGAGRSGGAVLVERKTSASVRIHTPRPPEAEQRHRRRSPNRGADEESRSCEWWLPSSGPGSAPMRMRWEVLRLSAAFHSPARRVADEESRSCECSRRPNMPKASLRRRKCA